MHSVGVEITLTPERLHVWGFCPRTEEERLKGLSCSELARVDLPPEPLPRPFLDGGSWRLPCQNCSGIGTIMKPDGYPRPVRCPVCAGTKKGVQVSSLHPWFRWNDLPREKPTGRCVVEVNPREFADRPGAFTTKRLESGKLITIIDFDLKAADL